jgi:hypothetical protein
MSINTRRLIDFLELENLQHGFAHNGNLVAPYGQLEAFGMSRRLINSAIKQAVNLRLIEVRRGYRLAWGKEKPNRFRLTFRRTRVKPDQGEPYWIEAGNEWRTFSPAKSKGHHVARNECMSRYSPHENETKLPGNLATEMKRARVPQSEQLYISRSNDRLSSVHRKLGIERAEQQENENPLDAEAVLNAALRWLGTAPRGSRSRLARGIGISPSHLSNFLAGRRPFAAAALGRLQKWLEIEIRVMGRTQTITTRHVALVKGPRYGTRGTLPRA